MRKLFFFFRLWLFVCNFVDRVKKEKETLHQLGSIGLCRDIWKLVDQTISFVNEERRTKFSRYSSKTFLPFSSFQHVHEHAKYHMSDMFSTIRLCRKDQFFSKGKTRKKNRTSLRISSDRRGINRVFVVKFVILHYMLIMLECVTMKIIHYFVFGKMWKTVRSFDEYLI